MSPKISKKPDGPLGSSFRDPAGFVFRREGRLYRHVNERYRAIYEVLKNSGLLAELQGAGLLVPHEEASLALSPVPGAFRVLAPELLPFVSYPYEWCHGQLRAAALLTLDLQNRALARGLSLKDASAFNVQWRGTRPVHVDTLSFEVYEEGRPWKAYGQFCRHFLAPLSLSRYTHEGLGSLLRIHLDGLPLDMATSLLPWRTHLSFPLLTHIHLHARAQRRWSDRPELGKEATMSLTAMLGLIDSLEGAIRGLTARSLPSGWSRYGDETPSYAPEARAHKETTLQSWLEAATPGLLWDLGANTGRYACIASKLGHDAVALDGDPITVQACFEAGRREKSLRLLPLVMDLSNPSPSLGWSGQERESLEDRGPTDLALALALVHHLAIGANLPLPRIVDFLARTAKSAIVEFVPKSDPMVARLLACREDVFTDYDRDAFEAAFEARFTIDEVVALRQSERRLYRMRRKRGTGL